MSAEPRGGWLPAFAAVALALVCYSQSFERRAGFFHAMGVDLVLADGRLIPWLDTRVITAGGEAQKLGLDPLVSNPTDPLHRPMNYPRIWQRLFVLDIDQKDTAWLAALFIAVYVAGVCVVLRLVPGGAAALVLLAAFSPAALLGLERANSDLFVFGLVALALRLAELRATAGAALVAFAALLKVFPILGLAGLVRRAPRLAVAVGAAFGAYAFALRDEIRRVAETTARGTHGSYGLGVVPRWLELRGLGRYAPAASLAEPILALAVAGLGIAWAWRGRARFASLPAGPQERSTFLAGAAIFLGTFLAGSNWSYRLLFALLCLPQLFALRASPPWRRTATATISVLLLALWTALFRSYVLGYDAAFVLEQAAAWALFGLLAALLAAHLGAEAGALRSTSRAPASAGTS